MSESKHIERFQLKELQHKEQQQQRKEDKEQEQEQQLKEREKDEDEKWLPKSRPVRVPERVYDEHGAWQDVAAALEPEDEAAFNEWKPPCTMPRAREPPISLWSTGRLTNRERWIADRKDGANAAAAAIAAAAAAATEMSAAASIEAAANEAVAAARSGTMSLRHGGYRGWTAPYATIDHHAPPPPPTPIDLTPPASPMPRSAAAVMAAAATLWRTDAAAAAAAEPLKEQPEHEADDHVGPVHEKSVGH